MKIRAIDSAEFAETKAIYAHHVLHGTGTFEEVPPSIEEMEGRILALQHPLAAGVISGVEAAQ